MAIGIYGLLSKRHLLKVLISTELIATAASMNFVLLCSPSSRVLGEAFLILALSTDTCLTAVILALMLTISREYRMRDLRALPKLEEGSRTEGG